MWEELWRCHGGTRSVSSVSAGGAWVSLFQGVPWA